MECPIQPPARNIESLRAIKIVWRNQIFNFPEPSTTSEILDVETTSLINEISSNTEDNADNPETSPPADEVDSTSGRKRRSTGKN